MKNIGKPCAGKPHARFDEGGLAKAAKARLLRHRQTKGAETDRPSLKSQQPALYSTKLEVADDEQTALVREVCVPPHLLNHPSVVLIVQGAEEDEGNYVGGWLVVPCADIGILHEGFALVRRVWLNASHCSDEISLVAHGISQAQCRSIRRR